MMVFFKHLVTLFLFDILSFTLCKIGVCYNDRRLLGNDWFCCDNFELRGNICVECRLGYTSSNKTSCVPCSKNTFGKRCSEKCDCTETERCDHVKGCLRFYSKSVISTESLFQNTAIETKTTNIVSSSSDIAKTLDEKHSTGKCRLDVKNIVYGSIGLLIGVGISVMFMLSRKYLLRSKGTYPTNAEAHASFEIQGETVNAYEEIDDITLISHDININLNNENSATSSNSIVTEQRMVNNDNSVYLNPYQPIIPTTNHHMYMTVVSKTACSNIGVEVSAVDSQSLSDEEKVDGSKKKDLLSRFPQQLNYVELQMHTEMSQNSEIAGKYENTSIFPNQLSNKQPSPEKIQYVEIVHTI